jgi:hypothetical protein
MLMRAPIIKCVISALLIHTADAAPLEFGGTLVAAGATAMANVPLSAEEKSFASDATRNVPDHAVAVIALPPSFDPHRSTPVLVVFSTSDLKRLNRDDLVDFYRNAALSQGWVVLAGDGRDAPPHDTNGWRAAMTLAALDALHRSFPGSDRWPIAIAGFSGGAKRASLLAPLLSLKSYRLCGLYLAGVNEDVLSISYRKSKLGSAFLNVPVFVSGGVKDSIAPPERAQAVADSMKSTGFRNVRFELFSGGHAVKNDHTVRALRWFDQLRTAPQ